MVQRKAHCPYLERVPVLMERTVVAKQWPSWGGTGGRGGRVWAPDVGQPVCMGDKGS